MDRTRYVGYIELKEGILLEPDCLGKTFTVNIDGTEGQLLTPSLPFNFANLDVDNARMNLVQPESEPNFRDHLKWGETASWPHGTSRVRLFRIEFNSPISETYRKKISTSIHNWIQRMRKNLYAVDYNLDLPSVTSDRVDTEKYYFTLFSPSLGENKVSISDQLPERISVNIPVGLEIERFSEVLRKTSENFTLKLEYQLLKNAQTALRLGNYRESILDAATAFELALTNLLLENLQVERKLKEKILQQNNSIKKKRDLLDFIDVKLPHKPKKYQNVEMLRNRAIHIGKEPTKEDAGEAFLTVKEALEQISSSKYENS